MHANAIKLAAKNDFLSLYPKFNKDTTALLSECDKVISSMPKDEQNVEIAKIMLKYELFSEADCYDDVGTPDESEPVSH